MLGPLTKELSEKNRALQKGEYSQLIQEIIQCYAIPEVPPPVLLQLAQPKAIVEAYESQDMPPPPIALKKVKFLFWLESLKSIVFVTALFFVLMWVILKSHNLPFLTGIGLATGFIFGSLIIIHLISKAIERAWDKRIKKNWATIFYSK